jgi:hypothetical protein
MLLSTKSLELAKICENLKLKETVFSSLEKFEGDINKKPYGSGTWCLIFKFD